jgi:glycosyltransferase involved in cell wall biosynthesis
MLIYSPPLPLALAGGAYRRWYGAPFVLNVQDLYPQTVIDLGLLRNGLAIKAAEKLEATAYRLADRIVVHSPGNQEFLVDRKGVQPAKVKVIYNWVDVERVQPGPKENGFRHQHGLTGRFVVSFAGLMGYAQDLSIVIAAAESLQDRPQIVFLLVGEGVGEANWKAMVKQKRLRNVQFLPMQPKDTYLRLLAASDVCLVPLTSDLRTPVVPGKLQSIMASGRPVIATVPLGGDTSGIIHKAQCGYAIQPGNLRDFCDAVLRLYNVPGLSHKLGASGRAYAERHFSLTSCCEAYEQVFEEVVAGGRMRA